MKKITLSILIGISFLFSACGEDANITKVKEFSTGDLSIGQILEKWDNCEDGEWVTFDTDYSDEKGVSYTCTRVGKDDFTDKVKSFFTERELDEKSFHPIDKHEYYIEFMLGKNNKINLNYMGEEIQFTDEKIASIPSGNTERDLIKVLGAINKNKYSYYSEKKLEELDELKANRYLKNMKFAYLNALLEEELQ